MSSFVSIALAPTPIVAFALRLPSRLASYLNGNNYRSRSDGPKSGSPLIDGSAAPLPPTFKIHLLSEEQENLARAFARQPPLPHRAIPSRPPPSSPSNSMTTTTATATHGNAGNSDAGRFDPFPLHLFQELQDGSLGNLECSLAGKLHLVDPLVESVAVPATTPADGDPEVGIPSETAAGHGHLRKRQHSAGEATSQLFLARVLTVDNVNPDRKPLLYWQQQYCGVSK